MIRGLVLTLFVFFVSIISINAYESYKQGDIVTYNNDNYYVIYDSDSNSNILTLLKAEPLTVSEVKKYGRGHINNYSMYSAHQVYDYNSSGYGRIVYYSSTQCGLVNGENITNDCKYDYNSSDVKCVVDAWANDKLNEKDLWKDNLGYSYRLITKEEVLEYMSYSLYEEHNFSYTPMNGKTPSWLYNEKYFYFTMSDINRINKFGSQTIGVYSVGDDGKLLPGALPYVTPGAIRPVILLRKKALEKKNNSNIGENIIDNSTNNYNNINSLKDTTSKSVVGKGSIVVNVPDTLTKISVLFITFGICLVGISTILYFYNTKKRGENEKDN